jgi:hypothetical protein
MAITGTIMYTATYIGHRGRLVQERRAVEKKAVEEYYEKHGAPGHH